MTKKFIVGFLIVSSSYAYSLPEPTDKVIYNNFNQSVEKALMDDELKAIKEDKESLLMSDSAYPPTKTDALYSDYKNNELSANKKYKGKKIRVSGITEAISEDFLGNGVIKSRSDDVFVGSVVFNVNKNDDYVLNMSAGDKVDMICVGGGFSMGSPILNECKSTKSAMILKMSTKPADPAVKEFSDFFSYVIYMSNQDLIDRRCSSLMACEKFVNSFLSNKSGNSDLSGVTEDEIKQRLVKVIMFIHNNELGLQKKYPVASKFTSQ